MTARWTIACAALWLAAFARAGEHSSPRFKNLRLYSNAQQVVSTVSQARAPESAHFTTSLKTASPAQARLWSAAGGLALGLAAFALLALAWRRRTAARQSAALAVVAHELKTPLSAIETYLELMVQEGAASDAAQAQQWLEDARHLKSTTAGLRQTLADLLEAAQLESGTLKLVRAPIDLRALAQDCLRLHSARAHACGVSLALSAADGLPAADADAARLRQVFHNLLSNALRHTPSGGAVRVSLEKAENGGLECAIADTGPGIAEEAQGRLFKKFSRLAAPDGDGAGLGLYICRAIIESHGGRIWVESAVGRGSRYRFTVGASAHA